MHGRAHATLHLALCACATQIESTVVEQLGVARKVTVGSTNTTLIADGASKDEIDMRVAQLKKVGQRLVFVSKEVLLDFAGAGREARHGWSPALWSMVLGVLSAAAKPAAVLLLPSPAPISGLLCRLKSAFLHLLPSLQELASTDSVYDTEKLSERIAKLSGGVAVIKVRRACCQPVLCRGRDQGAKGMLPTCPVSWQGSKGVQGGRGRWGRLQLACQAA